MCICVVTPLIHLDTGDGCRHAIQYDRNHQMFSGCPAVCRKVCLLRKEGLFLSSGKRSQIERKVFDTSGWSQQAEWRGGSFTSRFLCFLQNFRFLVIRCS